MEAISIILILLGLIIIFLICKLAQLNDELTRTNSLARKEKEEFEKIETELQAKCNKTSSEVATLLKELSNQDKEFCELNEKSDETTRKYEHMKAEVATRDQIINKLQKQIDAEQADIPRRIELLAQQKMEHKIAVCPKLDLFLQQEDHSLKDGFFDTERTRQLALAFFSSTYDQFVRNVMTRAPTAAEKLRQIKQKAIETQIENVSLKAELAYLHELFPDLPEYMEEQIEEEQVEIKTTGSDWLTKEEWSTLSECARNQLALDRYVISRKKTKWQIGRDFELYVGHRYRTHGWQVQQFGIERGLEDLGRDLICTKDGKTAIVQCKCWSTERIIHEKHINQLFGTAVEYAVRNKIKIETARSYDLFPEMLAKANIVPVFATTTQLSDTAKAFAELLGVKVKTVEPGWETAFPRIKCNVGREGAKIYHLPFDQQYDTTIIEPERGECYALTCAEAEAKGFRRAWRFHGR